MSWPIPVTLKLQWSAIHVSCPLGGLRSKCLKDCSNSKCCYKVFSTWIWPNQLGCPKMVLTSKLLREIKKIMNFEPALPLPHKEHNPPQMVLQPNRQLRCSYTPLFSMRVGLGVTDVESRVFPISPHSSPLQRGRVRWLVTRQFLCAIQVLTCQEF